MNRILLIIFSVIFLAINPKASAAIYNDNDDINATQFSVTRKGHNQATVRMNLVLDNLHLGKNQQLFVTPAIANGSQERNLPTVLINGRNMHYVFLRTHKIPQNYELDSEIFHKNGTSQSLEYSHDITMEPWMLDEDVTFTLTIDTCGCGRSKGKDIIKKVIDLNPAKKMQILPYPMPVAEEEKLFIHHGRARVQFEVDRTELHVGPYKCKRDGKILDNREQLQIVEDSLYYALNTPNVELHSLSICGYASPESPYLHNVELASGRSKALLEYIEDKFNLPTEKCSYDYVPENWGEFREMVVDETRTDITAEDRANLLELIDRQVFLPQEYDAKETELKTGAKLKAIYASTILPEWFPLLRCTEFFIRTHLKPMSDEQLREVIKTQPELLSLNQIYRVARMCEHGSAEFQQAMKAALTYYPEDLTANANAAALAIEDRNYDLADRYLDKAGNTNDVFVMRGIVATHRGNFEEARNWLNKAKNSVEAQANLKLIEGF